MKSHVKVAVVAAVLAGALAAPAAASATTLWVSEAPTVAGNGTSCTKPGFNKIQSAIGAAAAGSVIDICSGTYVEQLQVTEGLTLKAAGAGVTVQLPASPQNSTTTCDTEIPSPQYEPNQDLLAICTSGTVTIQGLKFEAKWPAGTCYDSEYGIFAGGGATVKITGTTVADAGNPPPDPASGCQGGVAIQLGSARVTPNEVAHGFLSNDIVTNYQKNGIDVTGAGATGVIGGTTVTGSGPTEHIAQNGIEVAFGGSAKIKTSSVSGNECNVAVCGPNPITQTQATGVLLLAAAPGTSVSSSTISHNDIGVYYEDEEATAPSKPQVLISSNQLNEDRYESVALGKGSATVNGNTITGGTVGIAPLQFANEPYGIKSTGAKDNMSGLSSYAVNGFSDKEPTDKPGSFSITSSHISGNPPGAGVTESVHSESPTLTITTSPTDT